MMNPLDIIKRLDVKQNVRIRVIDDATGEVVQEHDGHNAATNSLLTGTVSSLVETKTYCHSASRTTFVPAPIFTFLYVIDSL